MGIGVSGGDLAIANFERLLNTLYQTTAVRDAFMPSALAIRDDAKSNAPVRTGRFRDHIFATTGPLLFDQNGNVVANVIVGVSLEEVPYARIVEFHVRPTLRPAAAREEPRIEGRVAAELERVIEESIR